MLPYFPKLIGILKVFATFFLFCKKFGCTETVLRFGNLDLILIFRIIYVTQPLMVLRFRRSVLVRIVYQVIWKHGKVLALDVK